MGKVLLAAIDSSPQHHQVLAKSAELADCMAAELHVASVIDLCRHREASFAAPNAEMMAVMDAEVRALLKETRRTLGTKGIACHTHAAYGATADQIALLARQLRADIIVIGHRHLSWLSRLIEGSVGSDLLACSPCSVLIVIEPGETIATDDAVEEFSRPS